MFSKLMALLQIDSSEINPDPELAESRHARGGFYIAATASLIVAVISVITFAQLNMATNGKLAACYLVLIGLCAAIFIGSVRVLLNPRRPNMPSVSTSNKTDYSRAILDSYRERAIGHEPGSNATTDTEVTSSDD